MIDPTSGEQTEINERGPAVSAEEVERFVERLRYLARRRRALRARRHPAAAAPATISTRAWSRSSSERGVDGVLDAEGEPMLPACAPGPRSVTPNEREAEELVGQEFNDRERPAQRSAELVELGAGRSRDHPARRLRRGRCWRTTTERHCLEVTAAPVEPVSTVGSGDAFLAGFVAARYDGRPPEECLAYGVACGAESTQHFGAGQHRPPPRSSACCRASRSVSSRRRRSLAGLLDANFAHIAENASTAARLVAGAALTAVILGGALVKDLRNAAISAFPAPRRGVFSSANERRVRQWKSRSAAARRAAGHTASMTSRSSPRAGPATPTTSTSAGPSVPTASSCRCSPRRWTASSAPGPPA